jgi:hypothetical protein
MSVILYVGLNAASKDSLEILLAQQIPSIAGRFSPLHAITPDHDLLFDRMLGYSYSTLVPRPEAQGDGA